MSRERLRGAAVTTRSRSRANRLAVATLPRPLAMGALIIVLAIVSCGDDGEDGQPPPAADGSSPTAESTEPTATATPGGTPGQTPSATAQASPGQPQTGQTPGVHVVQPGDTLTSIAEQYGTTVQALVEANAIEDPDVIAVGQELTIPGGALETP